MRHGRHLWRRSSRRPDGRYSRHARTDRSAKADHLLMTARAEERGFDWGSAPVACRLCGVALGTPLLVHTERDRFEVAVGIAAEDYIRCWRRCAVCQVVQNVQAPANEYALDALSASYYELDLGNNLRPKYERVIAMPASASDNAGRVTRVLDFVRRRRPGAGTRHVIG